MHTRMLPVGASRPALQLLRYRGEFSDSQWSELCEAWDEARRDASLASGGYATEAEVTVAANEVVRRMAAGMIARPCPAEVECERLGIFSPATAGILSDPSNLW